MRVLWLLVPLLFGCTRYVDVAGTQKGKAYLSADSTVVLQITPISSSALAVAPDRSSSMALWLPEGSYSVAFFCGIVASGNKLVSITASDRGTQQTMHLAAGRHYHLTCANNAPEVLRVEELGVAPNRSFKPNPRSPISRQTRDSTSISTRPTRCGSA